MRVFVLDGLIRGQLGHGYSWALAFHREAGRRGLPIQFWVHVDAEPEIVATLRADRVIRHSPYRRYNPDRIMGVLADFIEVAPDFARTLDRLDAQAIQAEDLVILSTPRMNELHGVAQWLKARAGRPVPRILGMLHNQDVHDDQTGQPTPLAAYFRFAAHQIMAHAPPNRFFMAVQTRQLAKDVARTLGIPVAVLPSPSFLQDEHPAPARPPEVPGGMWRVSLIGASDRRKGVERYPGIVSGIAARGLPVRLFMQVTEARNWKTEPEALQRIAAEPWVTIHHGALDAQAYARRLLETDIVLMPYDAPTYRAMASGLLHEAVALGKVIIVPADTWMAEQVVQGLAVGHIVRGENPATYVEALAAAIDRWPSLAGRTVEAARRWRTLNGTQAFFDAVLRLLVQGLPMPAKPAR